MLDRTELSMRGMAEPWIIPMPASPDRPYGIDAARLHEYKLQVTAYERTIDTDVYGAEIKKWHQKRPNDHYGSCERMQMVMALATGVVGLPML
jgi:hypothetical protein